MNKFDYIIKIAEAYTFLMKLLIKDSEYARQKASAMLQTLSENDDTHQDIEVSSITLLNSEDYGNIEKIFRTILESTLGLADHDIDSVYKLANSFRQVLNNFKMLEKREMPDTLKKMYNHVLEKTDIQDDLKLLIEDIKQTIYK